MYHTQSLIKREEIPNPWGLPEYTDREIEVLNILFRELSDLRPLLQHRKTGPGIEVNADIYLRDARVSIVFSDRRKVGRVPWLSEDWGGLIEVRIDHSRFSVRKLIKRVREYAELEKRMKPLFEQIIATVEARRKQPCTFEEYRLRHQSDDVLVIAQAAYFCDFDEDQLRRCLEQLQAPKAKQEVVK